MKISKIIFLAFSLILISCGKEESKKNTLNILNFNDIDGDFIPNNIDKEPYIADIPIINLDLSLQGGLSILQFSKSISDFALMVSTLNYHSSTQEQFKEASYSFSSKIQEPLLRAPELDNLSFDKSIRDLKFDLYLKNKKISSYQNNHLVSLDKLPKNYINDKIKLQNLDFNFYRYDKVYTYKKLLKSVSNATSKIIILKSGLYNEYHVSNLAPDDYKAKLIGLQSFEREYLENNKIPKYQDLIEFGGRWFKTLSSNKETLYYTFVTLKGLEALREIKKEKMQLSLGSNRIEINNIAHIQLSVTGQLEFSSPTNKQIDVKTTTHRGRSEIKCSYIKSSRKSKKIKISAKNLLQYFDIVLGSQVLNENDLKIDKNILKIEDLFTFSHIDLRLKEKFTGSFKVGDHISGIRKARRCKKLSSKSRLEKSVKIISNNDINIEIKKFINF